MLSEKLLESFMFNNLDENDFKIVLDAMEKKQFVSGDWVIKQGEDGDVLYIVIKGSLECT